MHTQKVIIIGAGPAGMSAAISLYREGIETLIIEKYMCGGMLSNAFWVENYPGFPGGINGCELALKMCTQLTDYKIKIYSEKVLSVKYDGSLFVISTDNNKYQSEYCIAASGTDPVKPDFLIDENVQDLVFSDIRNLFSLENKSICIIGSGDFAFDFALTLKKQNKITCMIRKEKLNCNRTLREKIKDSGKISIISNCTVKQIVKENGRAKIFASLYKSEERIYFFDFVVVAIGREPAIGFLSDSIKTSKPEKLFYCGDVINGSHRYLSIACGQGTQVAFKIIDKIKETI